MIEAKRDTEHWWEQPFAKRMSGRLLLRPQRAGRFYRCRDTWCRSPAPRQNRRWQRAMYWDTRAQAARACHEN
jgi:hypothetical protein